MAYERQNFVDGVTVLSAKHLKCIEDCLCSHDSTKVDKPSSGNGTAGQFLTSDGKGGTTWTTLSVYNGEVEDV